MLKQGLKLLGLSWLLALFPSTYLASRRGEVDEFVLPAALGFSLIPFAVGTLFLFWFRKSSDGGFKAAAIASFVITFLAFLGNMQATV